MDKSLLEQINEKIDIVDLVSEFVELSKKGKNYMGLCPFHQEKTPSFSVSPEKNIAKCMSCGEGGNPVNFYRKIKNITREQATQELAERVGIVVKKTQVKKHPHQHYYDLMQEVAQFYQFNLLNSEKGQHALAYIYQRQLKDEHIKHFKLGYAPPFGDDVYRMLKDKGYKTTDMIALGIVKQDQKGDYYDLFSDRIVFPITNQLGHVVGFSGRTIHPGENIKYINSPETPIFKKGELLYHYHEALPDIRKAKHAVLLEGFFDVIAAYNADIKNGLATMGTALTKEQAQLIKQATDSIIIAYDGDKAGQKATDQAIHVLSQAKLKVNILTIPDQMDPDDFVKAYGPEAFEKLFNDELLDPFKFRYQYYKKMYQLDDANDIKTFKEKILGMLRSADPSVQAIYLQKLAQDLKVDVQTLTIKKGIIKDDIATIPKKQIRYPLTKYVAAEIYLILVMLKSKENHDYIAKKLKLTETADKLNGALRLQIANYYESHDVMDIDALSDQLNDELRQHFTQTIQKNILYGKINAVLQTDIDDYIKVMKVLKDAMYINNLWARIEKLPEDDEQRHQLVAEKDELQKQLKHKN